MNLYGTVQRIMYNYIALLRGINVGGKNSVKMADLNRMFEEMELCSVQTYIQSGMERIVGSLKCSHRIRRLILY
ncbi:MAG: hypothetical protein H6Q72_4837 [Firmicutes bacterium]|nr:hypothetical protein [Bacillota bacterium]